MIPTTSQYAAAAEYLVLQDSNTAFAVYPPCLHAWGYPRCSSQKAVLATAPTTQNMHAVNCPVMLHIHAGPHLGGDGEP